MNATSDAPGVFISYVSISQDENERVRLLADDLRHAGIECWIDQYHSQPSEGWDAWLLRQMTESDFVLIVCTRTYQSLATGVSEQQGINPGKGGETEKINRLLSSAENRRRFIPVYFGAAGFASIPPQLRNQESYDLTSNDDYVALQMALRAPSVHAHSPFSQTHASSKEADPKQSLQDLEPSMSFPEKEAALKHSFDQFHETRFTEGAWAVLQVARRLGSSRRAVCSARRLTASLVLWGLIDPKSNHTGRWLVEQIKHNDQWILGQLSRIYKDIDDAQSPVFFYFHGLKRATTFMTEHLNEVIELASYLAQKSRTTDRELNVDTRVAARHLLAAAIRPTKRRTDVETFFEDDLGLDISVLRQQMVKDMPQWGTGDDPKQWAAFFHTATQLDPPEDKASEGQVPPQPKKTYRLQSTTSIARDAEAERLTTTAEKCKEALRKFITSSETKAPLTVSVEAPWGGGKSSLLRHLQTALESDGVPTVWFNPWKHEVGKTLWAAFAVSFERQMGLHTPWYGRLVRHVSLSWKRLTILERILLVVRIVLWLVAIGAVVWLICHGINLDDSTDTNGKSKTDAGPSIALLLTKSVPFLGGPLLLWAFLQDLAKQFGNPLKIDVTDFLSGNPHKGNLDDLHRFHEDFARLLRAYDPVPKMFRRLLRWRRKWEFTGPWHPIHVWNDMRYFWCRTRGPRRPAGRKRFRPGRIVVFVDDLDRCEAPKAADLLQSLHLMLNVSEDRQSPKLDRAVAPGVICVLGMDRDKVAAAVAAKHDKLLPFLRDDDQQPGALRRSAMDFGHEFLEKFIQLTLHLPAMHGADRDDYLRNVTGWAGKTVSVAARIEGIGVIKTADLTVISETQAQEDAMSSSSETAAEGLSTELAAAQARIIEVDESLNDGQIAFRCAEYVADALENNPRKLKQFVNLFRLQLYLAAAINVLDAETLSDQCISVIPGKLSAHHIAKLTALELACPLKMHEARECRPQDLSDKVRSCSTGNLRITMLLQHQAENSPMFDVLKAPLPLYFQQSESA